MTEHLTAGEKQMLLQFAREAMECAVLGKELPSLPADSLTSPLR